MAVYRSTFAKAARAESGRGVRAVKGRAIQNHHDHLDVACKDRAEWAG